MRKHLIAGIFAVAMLSIAPFAQSQIQNVKVTGGQLQGVIADGTTIPGDPYELFEKGRFNDTPILVGTNSNEGGLFSRGPVTAAAFEKQIRSGYGEKADVILSAYPHSTNA
jgi:carboxylesterase type B